MLLSLNRTVTLQNVTHFWYYNNPKKDGDYKTHALSCISVRYKQYQMQFYMVDNGTHLCHVFHRLHRHRLHRHRLKYLMFNHNVTHGRHVCTSYLWTVTVKVKVTLFVPEGRFGCRYKERIGCLHTHADNINIIDRQRHKSDNSAPDIGTWIGSIQKGITIKR